MENGPANKTVTQLSANLSNTLPPINMKALTKPLKGLSDIRRFFYTNEVPIYFISATKLN